MHRLAIFASGTGSNAKKIIEYFDNHPNIQVVLVVSNKASAPVLDMARAKGIDQMVINREDFYQSERILDDFRVKGVNFVVLAGFLWLIPSYFVKHFENRLINIHPALLPKYGGKGMYGMNVHRAVKEAQESKSGITIHHVNEHYDEGNIIFQTECDITPDDDAKAIAKKVQQLEHLHFAPIIEKLLIKT
jgi:phosphoribosylglycinamide formyltransferase-1